ncbi:hypothetical protein L7F22_025150, partial [Adiantum nelumboides]|nr:hypothetical protein [Adiantum nelumboides]
MQYKDLGGEGGHGKVADVMEQALRSFEGGNIGGCQVLSVHCEEVISSQIDIDEETGFSEPVHAMHASMAPNSDQATCLSKSVCDVDAYLECSLGVDHEENAYATLHAKATILANAIQEGFMSMAAFQDTGDDADVFDVNPDKDYDYGDAGVPNDDQSMIATGYRVCYDVAMKKEIDVIFLMHTDTCAIEVKRYLNGCAKLPEQFLLMYETCNEVLCDDTHKIDGSSKEEAMKLMDLLDDALEEFRVPCDKSSKEHPATYDRELMMLLDEALEEFVPTKEANHAAFL